MPKPVGHPKAGPKRVMVNLSAHHAEQLQRIADENDTKLATLCANILERYVFEEQGILASDILKNAVTTTVHKEMLSFGNRVRALLSRTALESIATRYVARVILQTRLEPGEADSYNDQAYRYAIHMLKNPSPAIREAVALLSENIANDDPGILLKVRESNEEVSKALADVEEVSQQMTELMENQNRMMQVTEKMAERIRVLEEYVAEADTRAAETFMATLKGLEEQHGKGLADKVIHLVKRR